MDERRKDGGESGQGSWSDEIDEEGERKGRQERKKGKEKGKKEKVQKVEKDGKFEKVEEILQVQKAEKDEKIEEILTEARTNRQMIQIFIKVNGLKEFLLDVSMRDKVSDIVRRILNSAGSSRQDVYMTCEGRVLRWNDETRSSGVSDGCTVQNMNKMRGGGKHRNKKNKVEKKQAKSPRSREPVRDQQEHDEEKIIHNSEPEQRQQEPKKDKRMLSRENAEDEVIRHFEKTEATRKMFADLAKGSKCDMERWIQNYTEFAGMDDEQKKTEANGIRRLVEASGSGAGRKPTAAQEQDRRVYFTTEEVEEARNGRRKF